ncbi:MAG: hypothetical protein FRX48_00461 [Lasallia pustulata]|uniref:Fungal N-terminal domain-containing protein n=1 Tax=Lasallia pustulata TaxID=136370 RepID=A0A5M8Q3I4_9LECA|nr:MAG: hypothetical protein FRX48_00461 [Lasallia pustulata]
MEPLSTAASVIVIYQRASYIGGLCFRYARGVHRANSQAELVMDEIITFQGSLRQLKRILDDEAEHNGGSNRLKVLEDVVNGISSILKCCKMDLGNLKTKLEEAEKEHEFKALVQRLVWPLKEEEVKRLLDNLRNAAAKIEEARGIDITYV